MNLCSGLEPAIRESLGGGNGWRNGAARVSYVAVTPLVCGSAICTCVDTFAFAGG